MVANTRKTVKPRTKKTVKPKKLSAWKTFWKKYCSMS